MAIKPLLIDANLLLLYLVGNCSIDSIAKSNRLKQYSAENFQDLKKFIHAANKIYVTPNIMTEISNLIDFTGQLLIDFYNVFREFMSLENVEEISLESKAISSRDEFLIYGLTDSGINSLAKKCLILTDDSKLYAYYCKKISSSADPSDEIINFYHIIQANW